jgi:signal transduction histidine kinase
LSEETTSFVADARISAERLITLVNDLLAVSRLEEGRIAVHPQPVDLADMTTDVVNDLTPLIHEKNQQISVSDAMSAPPVYGDPKLMREVVLNLLSNAIKYTPQDGSIAVSMKASGDMVQWAVRDTGIGISAEAQAHLFEKFYRAENAAVVNTEGTGLGLYLVRLVLERSGGRVWCESEEGRGATFTFTLPLAQEAAKSER